MPRERPWYEVLGVSPFADDVQIRDAYLRLVKAWHPDRFAADPERGARAEERLKEINAAYDLVRGSAFSPPPGPPSSKVATASSYSPSWFEYESAEPETPSLIPTSRGWFVRGVALVLALVFLFGTLANQLRTIGWMFAEGRALPRPAPVRAR